VRVGLHLQDHRTAASADDDDGDDDGDDDDDDDFPQKDDDDDEAFPNTFQLMCTEIMTILHFYIHSTFLCIGQNA
jgi:hypothetical protein